MSDNIFQGTLDAGYDPPVRVLGIALVVEEVGKEAKFVFRYPCPVVSAQDSTLSNDHSSEANNSDKLTTSSTGIVSSTGGTNSSTTGPNLSSSVNGSGAIDNSNKNSLSTSASSGRNGGTTTGRGKTKSQAAMEDIFFKFPSRVMAKLFRSKTPGEPMTLKIGGTIFCFRSMLLHPMNDYSTSAPSSDVVATKSLKSFADGPRSSVSDAMSTTSGTATINTNTISTTASVTSSSNSIYQKSKGLGMINSISIVVALFPEENPLDIPRFEPHSLPHSSYLQTKVGIDSSSQISLDVTGTSESESSHHLRSSSKKAEKSQQPSNSAKRENIPDESNKIKNDQSQTSIAFLAVRRAHVSLSRLCKVLYREERRCLYVSQNIKMLLEIMSNKEAERNAASKINTTTFEKKKETINDSSTFMSRSQANTHVDPSKNINNVADKARNIVETAMSYNLSDPTKLSNASKIREIEEQQEIMELMLAASARSAEDVSSTKTAPAMKSATLSTKTATVTDSTTVLNEEDDNSEKFDMRARRMKVPLFGNLARELAQSYHALARNGMHLNPSPASLLSNREGVVHLNNHIAVHIEAVSRSRFGKIVAEERAVSSSSRHHSDDLANLYQFPGKSIKFDSLPRAITNSISTLRSYHTLLFTNVTTAKLIQSMGSEEKDENMMNCISSHQHGLKKLLKVADPFKSMKDMAHEILLPISVVLDMANALVKSGACVAVPVIQRSTQFVCTAESTEKIASLSLSFAQQFGPLISPAIAVAVLTTPIVKIGRRGEGSFNRRKQMVQPSLGVVKDQCAVLLEMNQHVSNFGDEDNDEDEDNVRFQMLVDSLSSTLTSSRMYPGFQSIHHGQHLQDAFELALDAITMWLRAQSVIVELKEYLTFVRTLNKKPTMNIGEPPNASENKNLNNEELLCKIYNEGYLFNGNISTKALAWKMGIGDRKLKVMRDWGVREKKLMSIARMPTEGDDWGAS